MEAKYYTKLSDHKVQCLLCPHQCLIAEGKRGICKVRSNSKGALQADSYALLSASNTDPIEKKPLYHFFPGTEILSIGSLGCNFSCNCCQNYEISQHEVAGFPRLQKISTDRLVSIARTAATNIGIAFTYNEPFVGYEYMLEVAEAFKKESLYTVVVSNGYINHEPLVALLEYIDAFNIDLKAVEARGYKKTTSGELAHVLHTLKTINRKGKHLEITMLIIPGLNDGMEGFISMIKWIAESLGKSIPLHISRYFPRYKSNIPATSAELLIKLAEQASKYLDFVYIGNLPDENYQDTKCPNCGQLIIKRRGYQTRVVGLDALGGCSDCGDKIAIIH